MKSYWLISLLVLSVVYTNSLTFAPPMNNSPWSLGDSLSRNVHGTDVHGTRTAIFAETDEGNFPQSRSLGDVGKLMNDGSTEDFDIKITDETLVESAEINGFKNLQIDESVQSANLELDNDGETQLVNNPEDNEVLLVKKSKKMFMIILLVYLFCHPHASWALSLPDDFDHSLLDPAYCTPEIFVKELEIYTMSHEAVENRFLQSLASASFGKEGTAKLLLLFFTAYTRFNQEFVGNVARLRDLVSNETHKAILSANLEEENGIYDEDTLIELEELGIQRESVLNIPHPLLYQDMVTNLGKMVGSLYKYNSNKVVPEEIVDIKKVAIAELIADGKSGLLAAIYFGSELIVPALYTKLLQGLRESCNISNSDARFLILHIDVDHSHAKLLREIVVENCATKEERVKILKNAEKILKARVDFYDALRTQII